MKRTYKLLLLDLDGTLIGRDKQVSTRVLDAVCRAARCMKVVIASGREPGDILYYAALLGLDGIQISDGGAMLLDASTGKAVWHAALEYTQSSVIIARLNAEGFPFVATSPLGTAQNAEQLAGWELSRISAMDMSEETAGRVMSDYSDIPGISMVKAYLPYNGLWAVDFTRQGVNKGMAARKLADMLQIDIKDVVGVGDSYNDLAMLMECGLRIVMADAPPELKSIAHHVAPGVDHDGLATVIDEYLLAGMQNGTEEA